MAFEISGWLSFLLVNTFLISDVLFVNAILILASLRYIYSAPLVSSFLASVFLIRAVVCVAGGQCDRMQVACNSQRDLQDWLDLLTKHTHTTPSAHIHKPQSVCHTVSLHLFSGISLLTGTLVEPSPSRVSSLSTPPPTFSQLPSHAITPSRYSESRGGSTGNSYHTLPHLSSFEMSQSGGGPMWGPLEPLTTPKPWSLSCLRPAPPLRPSAALCFKEVQNTNLLKSVQTVLTGVMCC